MWQHLEEEDNGESLAQIHFKTVFSPQLVDSVDTELLDIERGYTCPLSHLLEKGSQANLQ